MAEEIRADYLKLTRLAGCVNEAADGVSNGLTQGRETFKVPAGAFGNTEDAINLDNAQNSAMTSGALATERLVRVLEEDVDRIYRVAFAYRDADMAAADELDRQAPAGGQQP